MNPSSEYAAASQDEVHLDDPIWASLGGKHANLAEGGILAKRYPQEIAPFGAIRDPTFASFRELRQLIPPKGNVVLVSSQELTPPDHLKIEAAFKLDQMVATTISTISPGVEAVILGRHDLPNMRRLIDITKPGPFATRTNELGDYFGIYINDELVAMAGERLRPGRYVEISAVCVHPDHRGKGYAQTLIGILSRLATQRDEVPMLHVLRENRSAIKVYEKLGFKRRRSFCVTVLEHATGTRGSEPWCASRLREASNTRDMSPPDNRRGTCTPT